MNDHAPGLLGLVLILLYDQADNLEASVMRGRLDPGPRPTRPRQAIVMLQLPMSITPLLVSWIDREASLGARLPIRSKSALSVGKT